jgi:hypothetical protein
MGVIRDGTPVITVRLKTINRAISNGRARVKSSGETGRRDSTERINAITGNTNSIQIRRIATNTNGAITSTPSIFAFVTVISTFTATHTMVVAFVALSFIVPISFNTQTALITKITFNTGTISSRCMRSTGITRITI